MIDSSTTANIGAVVWGLSSLRSACDARHPGCVSWFLRVVEIPEQRWECRWGEEIFDQHANLSAALDHIERLAAEHCPARIFVHGLDGTARGLGELPPSPAG